MSFNRLKTQQSIIELQKMKLERQERIITELKLSKLSDDAKEAKTDLKNEIRNVIRTGDVKFRSKAKCLQIIGNLKEETDEEYENKLHALGCGIPRFLTDMQARASERNTKHAEAQERRLKIEKEKEDAKIALEEAKKLEDEKAKMERMEALRDKRRKEKMQKIVKEKERLVRVENFKKANEFRRLKLLTRFGMDRLRKLIYIKRKNEKKSKELRKKTLLKFGFVKWKLYTVQIWEHRKNQADSFYKKYLMILCLRMWKENHLLEQSKMLVAIDWYEMKISEHILREWKVISKQTKMVEDFKMKHAEAHHNWSETLTFSFEYFLNFFFLTGILNGKLLSIGIVFQQSIKLKRKRNLEDNAGDLKFGSFYRIIFQTKTIRLTAYLYFSKTSKF